MLRYVCVLSCFVVVVTLLPCVVKCFARSRAYDGISDPDVINKLRDSTPIQCCKTFPTSMAPIQSREPIRVRGLPETYHMCMASKGIKWHQMHDMEVKQQTQIRTAPS